VFFGAVQTAEKVRGTGSSAMAMELLCVVAVVLGVHWGTLLVGLMASRLLKMSRADQIAVGFAGSQKTLMVGLQICLEAGFHVLPMVAYHIGQLLIDTLVADHLRKTAGIDQGSVEGPNSTDIEPARAGVARSAGKTGRS
jgi:solute carrier family 10 (sodium/bile acid cotransporter), member 7